MRGINGNRRLRISLDAMGGDFAPRETVAGAVLAAREHSQRIEILLVGDPDALGAELEKHCTTGLPLRVVAAPDAIPDGGHAAMVMHERSSSVAVAAQLVRDGEADAVVGVGHTGACMIAASWYLGRLPGIDRPAAGVALACAPHSFIIDLGANPDAKPAQLVQFAVLGTVFAKTMIRIANPTVALLSNGSEEGKGNKQVRAAYGLLKASGLNFVGNVEGSDIPAGKANVVVCDGFVGNVLVKLLEGYSGALLRRLAVLVPDETGPGLASFRSELEAMTDVTMSSQHIVFLGVNGVFVPGHGRARALAVKRALETAKLAVERDFIARMREELEKVRGLLSAVADS